MTVVDKTRQTKANAVARALVGTTIGDRIDQLAELRARKQDLEAQINTITAEYEAISAELMEAMEGQKTQKATGATATASITTSFVGNVTDWEALNTFIKKTGHFQLYQRRLSDPAVRELWQLKGGDIPGIERFTKKRLNLRAL